MGANSHAEGSDAIGTEPKSKDLQGRSAGAHAAQWCTWWPENAVINVPQQHYPENVVRVIKASIVTHYQPRR
jgi:hypothetical protein